MAYVQPFPRLIDTHCHISSQAFGDDQAAALARAGEAGVELVVDVGTEPEDWNRSLELAGAHSAVRCVLGLHPNSADRWSEPVEDSLRHLLTRPEVVGIGETGLDYYRLGASAEQQRAVFVKHLALAREFDLPAVIHARDACDDILDVLASEGSGMVGVMHSFMGSAGQARRVVALGYYVSISGPVTYKNAHTVREAAAVVPLDRLLIETDSPYLPPHPHRGKRNEPAYVSLTAAALASVKGLSAEELAQATTENARRLFGIA